MGRYRWYNFIGGFLLIMLYHEWLIRLIRIIAVPELREDPKDFLMNYLNHSILLLIIVLIDAAVIVLIGIEYKNLKAEKRE